MNKKVSHQRQWQLRQKEKGLCCMCKEKAVNKNYCEKHRKYNNTLNLKWHYSNKEKHAEMMKNWRKKNPDYFKKYYKKNKKSGGENGQDKYTVTSTGTD